MFGVRSPMKRPARKRRTREHIIADLSVNHVERQALLCGYITERVVHDYGIDLRLVTFNRKGETEVGSIFLQLKASDRLQFRPRRESFPFRIERRDLVLWLGQPMPVILIVYDARKSIAYWLYVQSHFRVREDFNLFAAGKTVTVAVPTANVVNPAAIRKFARFRNRVLGQMQGVVHDEDEDNHVR
jgi:Domain of unknown function (DUF4365)